MCQAKGLDKLIKSLGLISLLLFSYESLAYIPPPPPSSDFLTIDEPYNGSGTHRISTDGTWNVTWSNSSRSYENLHFGSENVTYVLEERADPEANNGEAVFGEVYRGSGRSKTISDKRINGNYFYRIKVCGSYECSSYTAVKAVELRYEYPSTLNLPSSDSDGSFDITWPLSEDRGRFGTNEDVSLRRLKPNSNTWESVVTGPHSSYHESTSISGSGQYSYQLVRYWYVYEPGWIWNHYNPAPPNCTELGYGRGGTIWQCSLSKTEKAKTITVLPPAKPGSLTLPTSSTGSFTLNWSQVSHADRYQVQQSRNGGAWSNIYFGSGRSKGIYQTPANYKYRVRACRGSYSDNHCSAWLESSQIEVVMPNPAAPTVTGKSNLADRDFKITWSEVAHATSYTVYRNGHAQTPTRPFQLDQNLGDGTYTYAVKACYSTHCKTSNSVTIRVLSVPSMPSNARILYKSGITDKHYTVAWHGQTTQVDHYKLHTKWAPYGTSNYQNKPVQTITVSASGNGTSRAGHTADGHYKYQIQACNASGCGALSSVVRADVMATVPVVPTGLAITNHSGLTDTSYTVKWNSQSRRVTHYQLRRATAPYGGGYGIETPSDVSATTANYTDGDGHYRYRVRACNEAGCSGYTGFKNTSILSVPDTPSSVRIDQKANAADRSYRLLWNSQTKRVTSYTLYSSQGSIGGSCGTETSRLVTDRVVNYSHQDNADGDYCYRVKACNESGCSAISTRVTTRVLGLPSAPANLRITAKSNLSDNTYTVAWNAQDRRVTGYELYRSTAPYGGAFGNETKYTTTATSYNFEESGDGDYRYRVRACNETGCGAFTTYTTASTLSVPDTPSSVRIDQKANAADRSYRLLWNSQTKRVTSYTLYSSQGSIGGSCGTETSRLVTDRVVNYSHQDNADGDYCYRVKACNESGCSAISIRVTTRVLGLPSAPANLRITAKSNLSDNTYTVAWNAQDRRVTGYELYRSTAPYGGAFGNETKYTTTATSYNFEESGDGDYRYRVRACNETGCGAFTTYTTASTLSVPDTPSSVRIDQKANAADRSYRLLWNSQTKRVTAYTLYSSQGSIGGSCGTETSRSLTDRVVNYSHQDNADGDYCYWVKACNEAGCSAISTRVTTRVLGLPSAPANLRITAKSNLSDNTYTVAWNAQDRRVTGYELYRSTAPYGGAFGNETKYTTTATSYNFEESGDGDYRYRVRACNETGCGAFTTYTTASTLSVPDTPSSVRIDQKANAADRSYRLLWNSQTKRVTSYTLYSSQGSIGGSCGTETSRLVTDRVVNYSHQDNADGDYCYRVKACNEAGCSVVSPMVTVRVLGWPATPTNLRIGDKQNNADANYTVQWDGQSRRVTHYELYIGQADYVASHHTPQYAPDRLLSSGSELTVPQVHNDGHYRYLVKACNETGCSDSSGYSYTTILKIPAVPSTVQVPAISKGAFVATLGYGDGRIESTRLQQSINSGDWQDAPVSVYAGKPNALALTRSAYVTGGTDTLATYRFRIAACNSSGCSDYSSPSAVIDIVPPGTPSGFVAVASEGTSHDAVDDDGTFVIQWQQIGDITSAGTLLRISYEVQDSLDNGQTWRSIALEDNRANTYAVIDQIQGVYTYRMRACLEQVGCGDWTHNINVQVAFRPEVVSQLTVPLTSTTGNYEISWSQSSGTISHYQLERNGQILASELTELSYAETDLEDGQYGYRVRACNDTVCSEWSSEQSSEVLHTPSAPQFSDADSQSDADGGFVLRWIAPDSGRVDLYQIKTSDSPHNNWQMAIDVGAVNEYAFTKPNGNYSYSLRACNRFTNDNLNCGPATEAHAVNVLHRPGMPTALELEPYSADGTYTLSWQAPEGVVSHYQIMENDRIKAAEVTATSSDLENGVDGTYSYRVSACNSAGCSAYSEEQASIEVLHTPTAPQFSDADSQSDADGGFVLRWIAPDSGRVDLYQIKTSDSPHNNWQMAIDVGAVNEYAFTKPNGNYSYSLRACNRFTNDNLNCGPATEAHAVNVLHRPGMPTALELEPYSADGTYTLSWQAPEGVVSHYQIMENDRIKAAEVTATSSDLENGVDGTYSYRVSACNSAGCSAYSEEQASIEVLHTPTAPQFSDADSQSDADGGFVLRWIAPDSGRVDLYQIKTSDSPHNNWQMAIDVGAVNEYAFTKPNGNYSYSLRACNRFTNDNLNCGPATEAHAVNVLHRPGMPTALELEPYSADGTYTLSWQAPEGVVSHYQIMENDRIKATEVTATSSDLENGVDGTYSYRVSACNSAGCSAYSEEQASLEVLHTPTAPQFLGGDSQNNGSGHYWLYWTAPQSGNVDFYQIKTSYSPHNSWQTAIDAGTAFEYTFTNPDGDYHYSIRACNRFANGTLNCGPATAEHSVEMLNAPEMPTGLEFFDTDPANGNYQLAWQAPQGVTDHYQLLENDRIGIDPITETQYSASDKTDGTYRYRVRACNTIGCSNYSEPEISIDIQRTPGVVRNLRGGNTGQPNQRTLTWQAPVIGAVTYYKVRSNLGAEHSINSAEGQLWVSTTFDFTPPVQQQTTTERVCGFHLWRCWWWKDQTIVVVEAQEGDHTYWISACNGQSCGGEVEHVFEIRYAPTSPSQISGTGFSSTGNYELSWQAGIGTITGYELQVRNQGENDWAWQTLSTANTLQHTISDQSVGNYEYHLRACNEGSCGNWSQIKSVTVDRYSIPDPEPIESVGDPGVPAGTDTVGSVEGQFRVNESGAASYTIPITLAAGTAGVAPQLSLVYNSQGGNGLVGKGWNLSGLSLISRCRQTLAQDRTALPINWSDQDRFCLNGQRLLVVSGNYGAPNSQYKTEIDSFIRVTAHGGSAGHPAYFSVEGKDGSTTFYGRTANAKQTTGNNQTYSWAISRLQDSVGNGIDFTYHNDAQGHRIAEINYAYGSTNSPNARVEFDYQDRADVLQAYIGGYNFKTKQRLTHIKSYSRYQGGDVLLRDYRLSYANDAETVAGVPQLSRLTSVSECTTDGSCLPPTRFTWQQGSDVADQFAAHNDGNNSIDMNNRHYLIDFKYADINGDGLQDMIYVSSYAKPKKRLFRKPKMTGHQNVHIMMNAGNGFVHGETTRYRDTVNHPLKPHVLDYNADGHQDMLIYSGSRQWELYLAIAGGEGYWSLERQYGINLPFGSEDISFADINADGLADAFDGKHYWLLERDSSQPASSNRTYRFGARQTIQCSNCDNTTEAKSAAGDFNGDGIADFMLSQYRIETKGHPRFPEYEKVYSYYLALSDRSTGQLQYRKLEDHSGNAHNIGTLSDYELFRPADFNADGLTDILYWNHTNKRWQLQLNRGADFADPMALITAQDIDTAQDQAVQLADINRDGYPDLTWQAGNQLKVRYWSTAQQTFSAAEHNLKSIVQRDEINHILMDYNGDSVTDYVKFLSHGGGHGGTFSYSSSGEAANGLWDAERNISGVITQITNGLGAVTELNYQRINQSDHYAPLEPRVTGCGWGCNGGDYGNDHSVYNDPFGDLPDDAQTLQPSPVSPVLPVNGALPIVSRVSSSAPVENNHHAKSHISYYYAAARAQALGRGSLGFKQLRTVDEQTGVSTTTTYRQDWPFIGSPWKTKVETANGHLLSQSTNHWALQGWQSHWPEQFKNNGSIRLGALKPHIAETEQQTYALQDNGSSAGSLLKTTTAQMTYDNYGNATQIINRDLDSYGTLLRKQTTTNSYGNSDYDREKGRLSSTSVSTERPGQSSQTRQSTFSYYSSGDLKGLLRTETLQSSGDQSQKLQTIHYYDDHGNPTHTTSQGWDGQQASTRHSVRNTYDSSGRYIVDSYQQYPGLGEKRISSVVRRNAYGSPIEVSDSLGSRAYSYYSPRGRKYFTYSDAGGWQKTSLSASSNECPSGTAYVTRTDNADGSQSQQCNDKLGRPMRKLSRGFDGTWIATDMHYDALGRTVRSSEPAYISSGSDQPAYWSHIIYDLLDRPIQITAADGSVSYKQYNGLDTVSINPQGQRKTETHNSLGEVIGVTDNLGGQTHYRHDALGQLTTMRDANGNQTQLVYDALGRKLSMNDPDKGHWQYHYNAFGELINQIDAKGQSSQIIYDGLGRKTQRIDKKQNGTIEQQTNWTYDTQANGLDQLAQVSNSHGYHLVAHYDRFGRNHQSDTTLPYVNGAAATFIEQQTFDHLGRVFQRFDASNGQQDNGHRGIQTQYNAYGYASAVVDVRHRNGDPISVYQRITAMDARGNIIGSEQRKGVINTHKTYNYATGLLEQINSTDYLGNSLQDLHYQWDNLGNLQSRSDYSGNKNLQESFYYDGLNRLNSADSGNQQQSVQYDLLGNITYKSDVGHYSYAGNGAGPHAVTQAGNTRYQYDANGNNVSSSDGRTLVYSTFDKVIEINKGSHKVTFAYGPERSRYQRTDHDSSTGESKTTYYLGNVELIDYSGGSRDGEREYKRQLGSAIETLLYKDDQLQSQTTHYLLHDHLGSIDVITDHLGKIVQELSFDAWGQRRNASDVQGIIAAEHKELIKHLTAFSTINRITNRGYTGHEMVDAVGIIHMNGRIYDAKLARFLQADPFIQAPYNTQSLNRYSYVWNNPLNATDPSGYFLSLIVGAIMTFMEVKLTTMIVGMAATAFVETIATGGSFGDALKAGFISGLSAWAFAAVGASDAFGYTFGDGTSQLAMNALGNGMVGGIMSVLQGGKFGHGFVSAGFSAFAKPGIRKAFGISKGAMPARVLSRAVIGGTLSKATGGKFANGAATAAFSQLLNDEQTLARERENNVQGGASDAQEKLSARERHYARNAENDAFLKEKGLYNRNDLTTDQLEDLEFKRVGAPEDKYHTWGAGNENNQKWVYDNGTRYGSYEIVIRPTDTGFMHVMDANVMGTLNYGGNPWSHFWRDVVPYYRYGNSPSDTTTGWQRFRRTFE